MNVLDVPCDPPHKFLATCPTCKCIEVHLVRCRLSGECRPCWNFDVRALRTVYFKPILAALKQKQSVLEIVVRSDEPDARRTRAKWALTRFKCGNIGVIAKDDFDDDLKPIVRFVITCPREGTQQVLGHFDPSETVSCATLLRPAEISLALERSVPFWGKQKTAQLRALYPDGIPLPHKIWEGSKDEETTETTDVEEESRTRRPRSFTAFGTLYGLGGISKGRKQLASTGKTAEQIKTCTACEGDSPLQVHEIAEAKRQLLQLVGSDQKHIPLTAAVRRGAANCRRPLRGQS